MRGEGGLVVAWVFTALFGIAVPKHWRIDDRQASMFVEWLDWVSPYSRSVLRGIIRATPIGYGTLVAVLLGASIDIVWGQRLPSPNLAHSIGPRIAAYGFLCGSVGVLGVIFFNRPRVAVAPALRKDVGVATRWIRLLRERFRGVDS